MSWAEDDSLGSNILVAYPSLDLKYLAVIEHLPCLLLLGAASTGRISVCSPCCGSPPLGYWP